MAARIRLEDLPAGLREKVSAQLMAEDQRRANRLCAQPSAAPTTHCTDPVRAQDPAGPPEGAKKTPRKVGPAGPNKTEAEYNRRLLHNLGRFEAITFRLPGGSRYTPDFSVFDEKAGVWSCHEVKGSFRLGSQGRALTAFKETAAAFPGFRFFWAERQKDGTYTVREYERGPKDHA